MHYVRKTSLEENTVCHSLISFVNSLGKSVLWEHYFKAVRKVVPKVLIYIFWLTMINWSVSFIVIKLNGGVEGRLSECSVFSCEAQWEISCAMCVWCCFSTAWPLVSCQSLFDPLSYFCHWGYTAWQQRKILNVYWMFIVIRFDIL